MATSSALTISKTEDVPPEIKVTKDYGLFNGYMAQRDLRQKHLERVVRSMKKYGYDSTEPIKVNKFMEVTDGQHRLRAAIICSLPVYYIVVEEDEPIDKIREMARATEPWSVTDYVTSYARQGNENYKLLLQFKEISDLTWDALMTACFRTQYVASNGGKARVNLLKEGKLVVTPTKEAEVTEFLNRLELFRDSFPGWKHRYFVIACAHVFSHPKYDHAKMVGKMEKGMGAKLGKRVSVDDYINLLQDIYNHGSRSGQVDFSRAARGMRDRLE
jgi:hypothetical protein